MWMYLYMYTYFWYQFVKSVFHWLYTILQHNAAYLAFKLIFILHSSRWTIATLCINLCIYAITVPDILFVALFSKTSPLPAILCTVWKTKTTLVWNFVPLFFTIGYTALLWFAETHWNPFFKSMLIIPYHELHKVMDISSCTDYHFHIKI